MGSYPSISWGFRVGILQTFLHDFHYICSNELWVLKAEKLLSYISFCMGASKPSQLIFNWIHALLNQLSQRLFGCCYAENFWMIRTIEMVLGYFGQRQLADVWEIVKEHSLCLRFYNCENALLLWLQGAKEKACNLSEEELNSWKIRELSLCEQVFNDMPLITLGLSMFCLWLLSYEWGRRRDIRSKESGRDANTRGEREDVGGSSTTTTGSNPVEPQSTPLHQPPPPPQAPCPCSCQTNLKAAIDSNATFLLLKISERLCMDCQESFDPSFALPCRSCPITHVDVEVAGGSSPGDTISTSTFCDVDPQSYPILKAAIEENIQELLHSILGSVCRGCRAELGACFGPLLSASASPVLCEDCEEVHAEFEPYNPRPG